MSLVSSKISHNVRGLNEARSTSKLAWIRFSILIANPVFRIQLPDGQGFVYVRVCVDEERLQLASTCMYLFFYIQNVKKCPRNYVHIE